MNFIYQVFITVGVVVFFYVLLVKKTDARKLPFPIKRYKNLHASLAKCIALYEGGNVSRKATAGFVLNAVVEHDVIERNLIIKEVKELHKFIKLIDSLNNHKIHNEFYALIKEARKGQKANLYTIRTKLEYVHSFLAAYLKRCTN